MDHYKRYEGEEVGKPKKKKSDARKKEKKKLSNEERREMQWVFTKCSKTFLYKKTKKFLYKQMAQKNIV